MKKTYLVYLIIVIAITIYFSILIIKQSTGLRYELVTPKFSEETKDCPCKDVNGLSYCGSSYQSCDYSENPVLDYELCPNFEQIFDGFGTCIPSTMIKINSYGFRDYEYPINKPDNSFRIVVLGDSYTFGWGIELNETYSKVLERLLNERDNDLKYEVLNFGVPGYNAAEKVEMLKYSAMKFDPDLIIFQYLIDDIINKAEFKQIEREEMQEYAKESGVSIDEISEIQIQMVHTRAYNKYLDGLRGDKFDEAWKLVEKSLKELNSITLNKTVLFWVDMKGPQLTRLNKICHDYGWSIIDERKYLLEFQEDERLIVHPKDPHPNAPANNLIAKEIYDKLIDDKLLTDKKS